MSKVLDTIFWRLIHNPNYYYAPSTIKNLFLTSIDSVVSNINCYTKNPVSDFTRIRKISASALIRFLLTISDKSMNSNLCDFFTLADDLPSQSAMCQRRNLLFPNALRRIMRLFTDNMTNLKTFNGYYLLACDGSDINIPYNPDDTETISFTWTLFMMSVTIFTRIFRSIHIPRKMKHMLWKIWLKCTIIRIIR